MSPVDGIRVVAADVSTGILLDSDLQWHVGKPNQQQWSHAFASEAEAEGFCAEFVNKHPDVELWIENAVGARRRIVHDKWKR
jgi:hypothetical protein